MILLSDLASETHQKGICMAHPETRSHSDLTIMIVSSLRDEERDYIVTVYTHMLLVIQLVQMRSYLS